MSHNIYSIIKKQNQKIELLDNIIEKYFEAFEIWANEKIKSKQTLKYQKEILHSIKVQRIALKWYLREMYGTKDLTKMSNLKKENHLKIKEKTDLIKKYISKINKLEAQNEEMAF